MEKRIYLKGFLAGAVILAGLSFNGIKSHAATDDASVMPDISNKQILMGFYHSWQSKGNDGYQRGTSKDLDLREVPEAYNVVAVAFMKGTGIPTFKPDGPTDAEFRAQVGELNKQGRPVLISLGGADAHIELRSGMEQAFANEIIRLVEVYGFDGLDIDLEQLAITAGDNQTVIPAALKLVKDHYRAEGKNFIVSMAPEFPYLKPNAPYAKYISSLEGYYDFIAPQLYNQGGDGVSVGSDWIAQNNDSKKFEFLYYMADSLIHGTRGYIQIPANKLVLGIPANNDAAATGFVKDPQAVYQAFDKLKTDGNPVKGLMTWSVNWDQGKNSAGVGYNGGFANSYADLIGTGSTTPIPDTTPPTQPTALKTDKVEFNQVSLSWTASTDNVSVAKYLVFANGQLVGDTRSANYLATSLKANTAYDFTVQAVDAAGNKSTISAPLKVTTAAEPQTTWSATAIYVGGDKVIYQGKTYQAQWWTQGETPGTAQVWKLI